MLLQNTQALLQVFKTAADGVRVDPNVETDIG